VKQGLRKRSFFLDLVTPKWGQFLLMTFLHSFKRFSRNTPPSRRKTPFHNLKNKKGKQPVHLIQNLNYTS